MHPFNLVVFRHQEHSSWSFSARFCFPQCTKVLGGQLWHCANHYPGRGFEKFVETQNIDTTKDATELSQHLADIYGSIFKETIGENKAFQSGGEGTGKYDEMWARQQERIKNSKK